MIYLVTETILTKKKKPDTLYIAKGSSEQVKNMMLRSLNDGLVDDRLLQFKELNDGRLIGSSYKGVYPTGHNLLIEAKPIEMIDSYNEKYPPIKKEKTPKHLNLSLDEIGIKELRIPYAEEAAKFPKAFSLTDKHYWLMPNDSEKQVYTYGEYGSHMTEGNEINSVRLLAVSDNIRKLHLRIEDTVTINGMDWFVSSPQTLVTINTIGDEIYRFYTVGKDGVTGIAKFYTYDRNGNPFPKKLWDWDLSDLKQWLINWAKTNHFGDIVFTKN